MTESFVMNSPVGKLAIEIEDNYLVGLEYHASRPITKTKLSPAARQVKKQIECYFKTSDFQFSLPVKLKGTEFQKKVWKAMLKIPAGKTRTYGEVSSLLNSSPRAVGNACRANPVPLVVPCHRIVAQSSIGGFGGKTAGRNIDCKNWLLTHEGYFS